jgi:hypothetical protein
MNKALTSLLGAAALLAISASSAMAAPATLSDSDPANGLYDIWSSTFDNGGAGLTNLACVAGSTYCTFFGGDPSAVHNITITPNPSMLANNGTTPGGIGPTGIPVAPVPAPGSFLDLTLGGGNASLTLGVSSITFNPVNLCLAVANGCAGINANAYNAGMVINAPGAAIGGALTPVGGGSTGDTVANDGFGKFVFEVNQSPTVMVDFSRFSQVVTSCTGIYCGFVSGDVLKLDMVRYALEIQYDPTYTTFTGKFIGQTANNSLVYANLNSVPVPAAAWLFGSALGLLGVARRRFA